MLTDQELINAFECGGPGKYYDATFIPLGERSNVTNWDIRPFKAANKAEATKIAREYGKRIIGKKMVYVYLASAKYKWLSY